MKLYDLYDNNQYIGAFPASEISKMIGCKPGYVSTAARLCYKVKYRYEIESAEDFTLSKEVDAKLLDDFDYLTKKIRKAAQEGKI